MNKQFFVVLLASLVIISCGESAKGKNGITYKSAVQYNDYIVNRQTTLIKNVMEFSKTADINIDSAEAKLKTYVKEAEVMIEELKGMPPYKGDSSLRDAAISSFQFYKKVFEKDYMDILQIRRKGYDITEEDAANANSIIERISKEEEGYDKRFHEAQRNYADKNNMKLTDNKMQKELDKLNGN